MYVVSSSSFPVHPDESLQVSGSARLSDLIQDIWTPDVKANQLADVISGIAPVRSVVNVGSGLANLLLLPIEQYRKDGRIGRGIQRGVTSFATTTTLEALNIGAKLSKGTQVILEQAEVVLGGKGANKGSGSTATTTENDGTNSMEASSADLISRYAEQPVDLREGIESAYRSLGDNLTSAAQTILAVPMEVYERSGTDVRSFFALHEHWLTNCGAGTSASCRSRCSARDYQAAHWRQRGIRVYVARSPELARS